MGHKLIVGMTESGKSILARTMVNSALAVMPDELIAVVYDPTLSTDWNTEFVTHDEGQFFQWLKMAHAQKKRIVAAVDEADTFFSMGQRYNWWVATRGRHFGIELIMITQRPKLVAPSARGQCNADVYCFQLGASDSKDLAEDVGAPGLTEATNLLQGQFLRAHWADKKKVVDMHKVF